MEYLPAAAPAAREGPQRRADDAAFRGRLVPVLRTEDPDALLFLGEHRGHRPVRSFLRYFRKDLLGLPDLSVQDLRADLQPDAGGRDQRRLPVRDPGTSVRKARKDRPDACGAGGTAHGLDLLVLGIQPLVLPLLPAGEDRRGLGQTGRRAPQQHDPALRPARALQSDLHADRGGLHRT